MSSPAKRAVCLVSGGMDSAVALAEARAQGFECHALSFDYGQRHKVELEAAARVAAALGAIEQRVVRVDLSALGGSALTDAIAVPKDRCEAEIGRGVPATYVPARNTVFPAVALGWAAGLGRRDPCPRRPKGEDSSPPEFVTQPVAVQRLKPVAGGVRNSGGLESSPGKNSSAFASTEARPTDSDP